MKNFNSTITLLALFFLSFYQLKAQEIENHRGKFFIGLNGGAAWQQSDLTPQLGLGWGLYLGSNLLYGPNSPLSLDWRLRYLGTATYGQDTKLSSGAIIKLPITNYDSSSLFMNHRTHFHDLSLEARINFEQLRRKSNIHLALYGGAGIGFYNVATDQLDNTGADYRSLYNSIDVNSSSAQIFNQIITGRDQVYETWLNNDASYKAFFTPNVGAELGIWIKSFLLGIGHRVNWTFKDDFDAVSRGSNNNIHHYTHLFLHFRIDGNRRENTVRNIDSRRHRIAHRLVDDGCLVGGYPIGRISSDYNCIITRIQGNIIGCKSISIKSETCLNDTINSEINVTWIGDLCYSCTDIQCWICYIKWVFSRIIDVNSRRKGLC